ncbi:MAG: N-6 DNA methylase [Saprospiraceae bacterium]|nr:N-6 DNA methylase [Saprospiraceae bacterium]
MNLQIFSQLNFLPALKVLFKDLKVPMNYVADEPTTAREILKDTYKENDSFQLMDDVYFVGMVDDAAFEGNKSLDAEKIKSDYDGILIFGVTLKNRPNSLLPTRSQLAEISRAFNREFYYTPVVVVFKYGYYLAFANTERLKYKQEWREGEKAGKVSLLRDIHIKKPHSGHERILAELQIPTTGTKKVDSFAKLYAYWQEVFSVSLLNKKFYQELSNWYFWATQHITFPGEPTIADAHNKKAKLEDLLQEHRATNVIRMLTRLLFVWFIKEKKLIPEELFELDALQKDILNEISPYHERGMFKERNKESVYYKAILQNLFFATLNCPIESDSLDKRTRGFRGDGYGTHRGIDYLMRYKQYFKNPDTFLEKLNQTVPFLNGGLFECLDDKFNNIYIDGFSDQMIKGEQLIVPDYLFFGVEEETDLSDIVGINDKKYKQAAVKGLINILKSYKFTITENTPIEEDVALDPELLGKVFENLLASYIPETKTTARKQTGSFYTPREIVNYMVDESLIAYLKNAFKDWGGLDDETLDKELHVLTSFDNKVPFADNPEIQREIITALSTCTILDPACGSGAFPMGILQKMVHILQKLDSENTIWKEVQLEKARKESEAAFEIEDKLAREERLLEINEAFDQSINDPDYARKLFLIENCIYGVDFQPIAVQISKLRFFISLVVEQKPGNKPENNFSIRPLPNLETKFVAANTLTGIEKPKLGDQLNLYSTEGLKTLESKLKKVRSKLFSAKSKETKLKYREEDKVLRNKIAEELEKSGWKSDTAQKLADWNPYDQNASSSFFDPEWMFDIKDGFDLVIGNPPYGISFNKTEIDSFRKSFNVIVGHSEAYYLFTEKGLTFLKNFGILSYITPNAWLSNKYARGLRTFILHNFDLNILINLNKKFVFESAGVEACIFLILKNEPSDKILLGSDVDPSTHFNYDKTIWLNQEHLVIGFSENPFIAEIWKLILDAEFKLSDVLDISNGFKPYQVGYGQNRKGLTLDANDVKLKIYHSGEKLDSTYVPQLKGKNINKYYKEWTEGYISWGPWLMSPKDLKYYTNEKILIRQIISDTLICTLDTDNYFADQTLYIGISYSSSDIKIKYTLAYLNSKMLGFFFKTYFSEDDDLFPKIKVNELKNLPFKKPQKFQSKLIEQIVTFCLFLNKNMIDSRTKMLESILDALIFEIYFTDHMKERGINVLEFAERDIAEVMQDREFEKLNDAEKRQVIEALYAKWNHPDNEVRNRIKLFAVRSPEILKPILESK